MKTNLKNETNIERIHFFQKIIYDSLDISIFDIKMFTAFSYHAKTKIDNDVNIYIEGDNILFSFSKIVNLQNGLLNCSLENIIIKNMLIDINKQLPILESLRFTNDNLSYYPVLPNLETVLFFKYNKENKNLSTGIHFYTTLEPESEIDSYYLIAKQKGVQRYNEREGFDVEYLLSGGLLHNDLEVYRKRMLTIWGIPLDKLDINYKDIGILTDMINI